MGAGRSNPPPTACRWELGKHTARLRRPPKPTSPAEHLQPTTGRGVGSSHFARFDATGAFLHTTPPEPSLDQWRLLSQWAPRGGARPGQAWYQAWPGRAP